MTGRAQSEMKTPGPDQDFDHPIRYVWELEEGPISIEGSLVLWYKSHRFCQILGMLTHEIRLQGVRCSRVEMGPIEGIHYGCVIAF